MSPLAVVCGAVLCEPTFSHSVTTPACDRRTDRQAHRLRSQPPRKCIPVLSTYRIRTRMPFVTEIRRLLSLLTWRLQDS